MTAQNPTSQHRTLTPFEVGLFIRAYREQRHWSQEQLGEISGLSVRTIQRVEQGQESSFDTRRALGVAFGFEDIDFLNKPLNLPTEEVLRAQQEEFEEENVVIPAHSLTTGRQLATLVADCDMDLSQPMFALPSEADAKFAALVDYHRDFRDCADLYSETQKLEVYAELQAHIDALTALQVSLYYATRKVAVGWDAEKPKRSITPASVLYVLAYPSGQIPKQVTVARKSRIGF